MPLDFCKFQQDMDALDSAIAKGYLDLFLPDLLCGNGLDLGCIDWDAFDTSEISNFEEELNHQYEFQNGLDRLESLHPAPGRRLAG